MALTEETSLSTTESPTSESASQTDPVKRDRRVMIGRVGALLSAVGITGAILFFAPQIQQFSKLGYLGVFLINLIADATIVVPIPGLGITFVTASVLSWPLVGLASGAGQALGESTGYLAGYGGG